MRGLFNRKVFRGTFFLTGLVLLLVAASVISEPNREGVYNVLAVEQKERDIKEKPECSIDVLFAGDSECYSSFCPSMLEEYGICAYVCGTSAQRLCDTYALLQSVFESQSPKVVCLETNCLYRFAGVVKETDDQVLAQAGKYFPVFRYHSRWKSYLSNETGDKKENGFKKRTSVKPYKGGEYMIPTEETEDIRSLAKEYLEKIEALCREYQAELILVSSPSAKNWNYRRHNAVEQLAQKMQVKYIDLNLIKEVGIDWNTDTKDGGDHLNYEGAKKVTEYMGRYLSDNYNLP